MIHEDRSAFVSAFAEAVRPDDAQGQSGKRMLMVAVTVVLTVMVAALVYGLIGKKGTATAGAATGFGQSGQLVPTMPGAGAAAGSSPPTHATWTAVAGPTCYAAGTNFSTSGYAAGPRSDPAAGWSTWSSGGYRGGGCGGGFLSVPMSGRAGAYDSTQYALWKFDFSARFTTAYCQLSTYVPDSSAVSSVGGDPTYYDYYGTDYPGGAKSAPLGSYQVYQVSHRGSWIADSSFTVTTGRVTVELLDAGKTSVNARHAAAQVRLSCQAHEIPRLPRVARPGAGEQMTAALRVAPRGWGAHRTIVAAVRDAEAGALVSIQPGTYTESIILDRDVRLVAEQGPRSVRIVGARGTALTVRGAGGVVEGLVLEGRNGEPAVSITAGTILITGCEITGGHVEVTGAAAPTLRGCTLHHTGDVALYLGGDSRATVEGTEIGDVGRAGVLVDQGAAPAVRRLSVTAPAATASGSAARAQGPSRTAT
jgi:FlaG/FlaF family flagellin (archaellin)